MTATTRTTFKATRMTKTLSTTNNILSESLQVWVDDIKNELLSWKLVGFFLNDGLAKKLENSYFL